MNAICPPIPASSFLPADPCCVWVRPAWLAGAGLWRGWAEKRGPYRWQPDRQHTCGPAGAGCAAFTAAERLADTGEEITVARLSAREREVMRRIAAGKRQADAAQLLGLSERTVEIHLRRIRHRLGASTTVEAIRVAVARGEIDA